jgi:hypothetical protein
MRENREQKKDKNPILRGGVSAVLSFMFFLFISSCTLSKEMVLEQENKSIDLESWRGVPIQTFTGWWVYGEGHHIFKDEETLEEYDLIFPNENMEELVDLYLAVCEMEYFPMECEMSAYIFFIDGVQFLEVTDFEILYIQGCGE